MQSLHFDDRVDVHHRSYAILGNSCCVDGTSCFACRHIQTPVGSTQVHLSAGASLTRSISMSPNTRLPPLRQPRAILQVGSGFLGGEAPDHHDGGGGQVRFRMTLGRTIATCINGVRGCLCEYLPIQAVREALTPAKRHTHPQRGRRRSQA